MIALDKDFIRLFSPDEQLIMLRLLLYADEEGKTKFNERGLSRETGISYQKVRTIRQRFLRDGVVNNAEDNNVIVCKYDNYKPLTEIKTQKKSSKKTDITLQKPIEERKTEFGMSLKPYTNEFGGKYSREMINDFYHYWTETNRSQTRMKFEMEKTWEVGRRLATWAKNNKVFNNNKNNYGRETATDKLRRTFEEANEFRNRLAAEREANLAAGDFD